MLETIIRFLTAAPLAELLLILVAKIAEVTLATIRNILINRGYRKQGTILSFFEIILWVFIASRVIMGIAEAPVKGIAYSIGYSLGVFFGSLIENKIALGKVLIQTIISEQQELVITPILREKGFAVTTIKAEGRDSKKTVLMIFTNRKGKERLVKEIRAIDQKAMIIINDVSSLHGGHIAARRGFIK
ncbi:hypothetical protein FACS1894190_10830 [Spirochaetia bacterium]|nr:hypothetical protein FACS1894190_10830 [Spirochaetia bacterium]GHV22014.1 hypothetical protein FACS189494_08220 [Spirochaetia bacterium]